MERADTVLYDRDYRGRPFKLDEVLDLSGVSGNDQHSQIPDWVIQDAVQSDTVYFGIGRSLISQAEADDLARLEFAKSVQVSVRSIARQQVEENQERLSELYSYEALVTTDLSLRGIRITERWTSEDGQYFSLIMYAKPAYHHLVTEEIRHVLQAAIKQQEMRHAATEALRADSLRHKILMDSLALRKQQAVVDSLQKILEMEILRQKQKDDYLALQKQQYASFLGIEPYHYVIDMMTPALPEKRGEIVTRWDLHSKALKEIRLGASFWLFGVEAEVISDKTLVTQLGMSLKLQILPPGGEIYQTSLALGWTGYSAEFDDLMELRLNEPINPADIIDVLQEDADDSPNTGSSFLIAGDVGIPQINSHVSVYWDDRKLSLSGAWYPFPRNLGDAISVINQLDFIRHEAYRNRFNDAFQWQFGVRFIAIQDRFATLLSYEEHEFWRLTFEFQY